MTLRKYKQYETMAMFFSKIFCDVSMRGEAAFRVFTLIVFNLQYMTAQNTFKSK